MIPKAARIKGRRVLMTSTSAPTGARNDPLSADALKTAWSVPFSFRSHARFCAALAAALLIAGGGLAVTTGRLAPHGHAAAPVLVDPAKLMHGEPAAPKEARLVPAVDAAAARRISHRIDIAEGVEDGAARVYTYQHVVLDLKTDAATGAHGRFAHWRSDPTLPVSPRTPVGGVPINVSLAKPAAGRGDRMHEIVLAPQTREKLEPMLRAAGVDAGDGARLEEALGRSELAPGDNLELLTDRRDDGAPAHVTLARLKHGDVGRGVYGRTDDGAFRANGNERLFARLSQDAMLTAYHPPAGDAGASIPARLRQAGAPADIVREVGRLAAKNGVSLDGSGRAPDLIDLLFRKSAETDPELVFVEFTTDGKSQRLYRNGDGTGDYFNEDGSSMTKYLMSKPLPNGRLNDGFGWRVHPVLHVRKHHNGVDYDAPIGSPIVAAGDGVVEVISAEKGYGKYVRIRHQGGYSTTYAHLSGAARGLKVGQHVKQGQVIAYVGSTGYSTGPHLYYELKVGDRYVDPLKAHLNAGEKLTGSSLTSFRDEIDHVGQIVNEMKWPTLGDAPPGGPPGAMPPGGGPDHGGGGRR